MEREWDHEEDEGKRGLMYWKTTSVWVKGLTGLKEDANNEEKR